MNIRKLLILFLATVLFSFAYAQNGNYDNYKFINAGIDTISYDPMALKSFFKKIKELKEGKRKNVVIVHIGDSHLQADFFSGRVRQQLQRDYGNGGRGLIFPYRVAGSNEPNNYHSSSTGEWKGRRCVMVSPSYIPVGVAGFGLRTDDSASSLKVNIKNGDSLNYAFNKMIVFHDKGPKTFDWVVYTTGDFKDSVIIRDTGSDYGAGTDSIVFKDTMSSFTMCTLQRDTSEFEAMIFGMVLTNGKPGIIYNTIGSNGARFCDYNHSQYFLQQLGSLKPDLIIVSLGTNEAYSKKFNPDYFQGDMDTMLTNLKLVAPGADFLLTTPNDAYRGHRYKNADIADAVVTIKNEASKYHAACWDFYHIMGGYGSMQKWYGKHLCQKDHVHFTAGGYTLQAELFYDALHKAIKDGLEKLTP
ncbi:MAG: GDSL-type esterase/lipase family protein [Bacteroidia bacterium]